MGFGWRVADIEEWREAYDERQREPTQSESADFGEGDSTGVQSLD